MTRKQVAKVVRHAPWAVTVAVFVSIGIRDLRAVAFLLVFIGAAAAVTVGWVVLLAWLESGPKGGE